MAQAVEIAEQELASGAPGKRGGEPHHQPQLDGVRGLAILAVLLSHTAVIINVLPRTRLTGIIVPFVVPGWGGVDLFFVLSGFLITGILLRSRSGRSYFKSFYARRTLRIFPIYYLFLICSLLLCSTIPALNKPNHGLGVLLPYSTLQKASFFFYLQNIPVFWSAPLAVGIVGMWGSFWSLAVEEQFYLVWPTLVRFLKPRWMFALCICGVIAGPFARNLIAHYSGESLGLLHFPVSRLDGLFAGAALAFYRERHGKPVSMAWSLGWLFLGALLLLYIVVFHRPELTDPGYFTDRIGISGFALVSVGLVALTQHDVPPLKAVLTSAPLRFLGKYSYGIYVYHLSVFFAFHYFGRILVSRRNSIMLDLLDCLWNLCAISTALAIAWVSFRYIEAPCLALKRFFPSPARVRQPMSHRAGVAPEV